MSNEIRARRMIVTLPGASGEHADEIAQLLEDYLNSPRHLEFDGATVTHALDDGDPMSELDVDIEADREARGVHADVHRFPFWTAAEARKYAAMLLRAADEAEADL